MSARIPGLPPLAPSRWPSSSRPRAQAAARWPGSTRALTRQFRRLPIERASQPSMLQRLCRAVLRRGRTLPQVSGTVWPPRCSSTGPRMSNCRNSTRASAMSATAATHRAPNVDSGDTSTSDPPTLMLSATASRSPPPTFATSPNRGQERRQHHARGAAPARDQPGHERHHSIHTPRRREAREQRREQIHPASLLEYRDENSDAAYHHDDAPRHALQRRRLVGHLREHMTAAAANAAMPTLALNTTTPTIQRPNDRDRHPVRPIEVDEGTASPSRGTSRAGNR